MAGIEHLPMPNTYIKLMVQASDDPEPLLAGTGLKATDITERDAPVRVWQQLRCARNSAAQMQRSDWHLAWVRRIAEHFHGPVTAAVLCAPTLGDGLDAMVRYLPIRIPYLSWRTRHDTDQACYEVRPLIDLGELEAVLLEVPLLTLLEYVRTVMAGRISPTTVAIEMTHTPLTDIAIYEDMFNCRFTFQAGRCALSIPGAWRGQDHAGHDRLLWDQAIRRCEAELALQPDAATVSQVARALMDSFESPWGRRTPPTLEDTAAYLHLSVRTLNRRLKAAGATFQQLVDDVRKTRARELLFDRSRMIGDIAADLGYRDQASFGRAFRRWYATTPSGYRREAEPA